MFQQYRLALVQMYSNMGLVEYNVAKAERYIRQAASNGAELILLPEAFSTGADFNNGEENLRYAERIDGPTLTRMRTIAKELSVYIVCPIVVNTGENCWENTAFFIDNQGNILGRYVKTHPVGCERDLVRRGTSYPVFDTKFGKIGISICYDICFPETSRLLALHGAEIVLVSAAWRGSHYFKEWWDINLQCRAIDNLVYVAAVNACGCTGDGSEMFAGKSQVINPIGQVQKMAGVEEETVLYQDIYPQRVAEERKSNPLLQDRYPEDYGDILSSFTLP